MHNFKTLPIALLLMALCHIAAAQKIDCDSLQQIIKIAASDSTFSPIKGSPVKNNNIKTLVISTARLSLWKDPDELYEETIDYNTVDHSYRYTAFANEDESGKEALASLKDCLRDGWIVKTEAEEADDTITYFKNTANFVVVKLENLMGNATIEIYNDRRHSVPECISGDCGGDAGTLQYFSEDTYSGTFINGSLSGIGQLSWYAQNLSYYGSVIDAHIAGFGTLYGGDGKAIKKGFFFNGDTVHVNLTSEGCQFGDCDNGFGLKMIANNIYAGNFKNGLPNGYGEMIAGRGNAQSAFFGIYQDGHDNGPGILVSNTGNFSFGKFVNGGLVGRYTVYMRDKTIKTGDAQSKTASYYGANNILLKTGSGEWGAADFSELKDPAYVEVRSAAQSLDAFYHQRETAYKDIIGEQPPLIKKLALKGGYKSKLAFEGKYSASIDIDRDDYYYITIRLSAAATPGVQFAAIYNKYYRILHQALGNRWHVSSDSGKAAAGKRTCNLAYQNVFDHSERISLVCDDNGVKLELH